MGLGSIGRWIKRAINGDEAGEEQPRVYGRGHPHRHPAPDTRWGAPVRASADAAADVIRPSVPVAETSALEQLFETQAEMVVADAGDGRGGMQGCAEWDLGRCDEDADVADDFFVAIPGGRFERAWSRGLPNRPRL